MLKEQILGLFSKEICAAIEKTGIDFEYLQEIRVRNGQLISLLVNGHEIYLEIHGTLKEIKGIVDVACGYSGYAFAEEISNGYLTIAGGHRIGLTGRVVVTERGIQTLKYISSVNVRVAHSVDGGVERWKRFLYKDKEPCHILLVSSPGRGKTTFLRNIIRIFSEGDELFQGVTVGVVDERSEICGMYRGIPSFLVGRRTDILDGCPKSYGMELLIRSMAPKVLAVDEIGIGDVPHIENALRCGCKVVATMHGADLTDFLGKPGFNKLVDEKIFERYIVLKNDDKPGQVWKIYDQNYQKIWEMAECI